MKSYWALQDDRSDVEIIKDRVAKARAKFFRIRDAANRRHQCAAIEEERYDWDKPDGLTLAALHRFRLSDRGQIP